MTIVLLIFALVGASNPINELNTSPVTKLSISGAFTYQIGRTKYEREKDPLTNKKGFDGTEVYPVHEWSHSREDYIVKYSYDLSPVKLPNPNSLLSSKGGLEKEFIVMNYVWTKSKLSPKPQGVSDPISDVSKWPSENGRKKLDQLAGMGTIKPFEAIMMNRVGNTIQNSRDVWLNNGRLLRNVLETARKGNQARGANGAGD